MARNISSHFLSTHTGKLLEIQVHCWWIAPGYQYHLSGEPSDLRSLCEQFSLKLLSTGEIISVRTVVKVLGTLVQTRTLSLARQVVIGSLNVFFFILWATKKEALLTCYISVVPEILQNRFLKVQANKTRGKLVARRCSGLVRMFVVYNLDEKKVIIGMCLFLLDDFISQQGYKDYKLILHTLGGFRDLFYLYSSTFFTVPPLFSAEYLSLSIHIHP